MGELRPLNSDAIDRGWMMSDGVSRERAAAYPTGGAWHKAGIVIAMLFTPTLAGKACSAYFNNPRTCEAIVGDILKASETNAATVGAKLIDIVEIKDGPKSETAIECNGLGLWSNAEKTPIRYRTYKEYDKWWVGYETDPT